MLRSAKELQSYSIYAADGDVGKVEAFFFDDESWKVRYLVAKAGGFFLNRQVLIAPGLVEDVDRDVGILYTDLTREQVKDSPGIETDRPVADQQEIAYYEHYAAEPYWSAGWQAMGPVVTPGDFERARYPETLDPSTTSPAEDETPIGNQGDPHLRSTREVEGYRIGATDGEVGHVEDFLIDDEEWEIRYVAVDTRNWLPGKKVLVSPAWVSQVSWPDKELYADLTREEIKSAPEWDPNAPLDREYETRLHEHYGRPPYWVYR